jgi:hypothetical protein
MKGFLITSSLAVIVAVTGFLPMSIMTSSGAAAVVCARGVVKAGCAGPNGAAVVARPPAATTRPPAAAVRPPAAVAGCRWVNGRKVCGVAH